MYTCSHIITDESDVGSQCFKICKSMFVQRLTTVEIGSEIAGFTKEVWVQSGSFIYRFNFPIKTVSVMVGRGHRFLDICQYMYHVS